MDLSVFFVSVFFEQLSSALSGSAPNHGLVYLVVDSSIRSQ